MSTQKTAGQVAYEAFRVQAGSRMPGSGAPVLVWAETSESMREAWHAAAAAVQAIAEPGEVRGRWYMVSYASVDYLIPVDRLRHWRSWMYDAEPGEPSGLLPAYARAAPAGLIITGFLG